MTTHTKNKPRTATSPHVHRNLALTTPVLQGPDIRKVQEACQHLTDHYEFDWLGLLIDAEYGKRTARRAAFCMELIGIDKELCDKTRRTGHISELNQRKLRNPQKFLDKADRVRQENRKPKWQKLRKEHRKGLDAAVQAMLKCKGTNEEPPSSNQGPFPINACQAWFGLERQPWCGCCVGYFIESDKGAGLGKTGTWWPHAAFIRADAEAGRNGLEDINPLFATLGCIGTLFDGGDDHVIFVTGKARNGLVPTVEGNTSSALQDADGGIVETKERPVGEFTCMAQLTIAAA